jgi:beta-galactosidase
MAAVARYIGALAARIAPLLAANGGPVLMIQIENEFGSYGSNRAYLDELCALWRSNGIDAPFYTEDGLDQLRQNRSNVPGGAIALSNGDAHQIRFAYETYRHVPVMAGEVYPGWLTHWGDAAMQGTAVDLSATLDAFMREKLSFNLYVIHGGTSFGYYAGANVDPTTLDYHPDMTSYDYSAPVTEQGVATPKFHVYRDIIGSWLPPDTPLPDIPAPLPTLSRPDDEALQPKRHASLWSNLPEPLPPDETIEPQAFEHYGQSYGFVLYRKRLDGYEGTRLTIDAVHDYATVFFDGRYAGGFSRTRVPQSYAEPLRIVQGMSLDLPPAAGTVLLEILVEGMGRVNYGPYLADRKGILGSVRLHDRAGNPHVLTGWEVILLPMDEDYIARLSRAAPSAEKTDKAGWFYRATLNLDAIGDTYLDMQRWTKGLVWVNNHALGRYWRIGPQHRLFCPAPWLTLGENTITIFDLHQSEPMPVTLARTLT